MDAPSALRAHGARDQSRQERLCPPGRLGRPDWKRLPACRQRQRRAAGSGQRQPEGKQTPSGALRPARRAKAVATADPGSQRSPPGLRAVHGVGAETAAQLLITAGDNPARIGSDVQFAALTRVAPIPASSGKTTRHRLSRGGDRAANAAIHRIVLVRMGNDQRTRDYVSRRRAEG